MTQFLPRSVLALLATTALTLGAQPAASAAAATLMLTPAVNDGSGAPARLILAAHHKKRHHHASVRHSTHKAAATSSEDDQPAGTPGARGEVVEVPGEAVTYEVKRGDTLEKVADKLGTDIAELKKLNHIKGSSIRAGETLKGPKGEASKAYVAKSGDRAAAIAERFGVSEKALLADNDLSRKARIKAGQKLALPEGARDHAPAPEPEAAPKKGRKGAKASAARAEEEAAPESYGRAAQGRVVETEGPARSYRVRKGDTLEKIADELDTDVATLKKDNHLRKSMIHPGQTLKGPRTRVKAYVVGPDDTISGVAHRFGVSVEKLRAANGLSRRHMSIHAGQKLVLPAGYRDHGPMAASRREETEPQPPVRPSAQPPVRPYTPYTPPSSEPSTTAPQPTTPRPYTPPATTPRPYTPPPSSRPYVPPSTSTPNLPSSASGPTDAQVSELGRGRFIWPLMGEIVSDFGPKSIGQKNDGINIKANVGDSVHAAAAGDVVYAGDQVPGFGNLVLIKHADGWVTAYAHLSRVDVKMQQKVSQGQQIGLAGQTGGLSEPQLHFEVRFAPNPLDRARPVDPKLVLPQP